MYEHLDISNHCKKMADAIDNEVIIRIRDFESVKQAKKYAEKYPPHTPYRQEWPEYWDEE